MFRESRAYRPPDRAPDRHAANGLLLSGVAVLALHVQRLPLWLSLGVCGLVAWRYLVENSGWRHPPGLVRWGLLLVAVVAVFDTYGTLLGREAGVSLLTLLAGLKILEIRSLRDYFISIFLLYFLTLAALLFSQSLLTAGLALAVAVITTAALVRLSAPNTLPASEGLRLTVAILWRAVPVMVVMYLLFPRIQGSLWGLPVDAFEAHTGLNDKVSPGSISTLYDNDAVAFRVDFAGPLPHARLLYWRSMVLAHTDGTSWSRSQRSVAANVERWPDLGVGKPIDYTVDFESTGRRWLVALDTPATVPAGAIAGPGFVIEAKRPVHQRFRYAMRSYLDHGAVPLSATARLFHLRTPRPPSWRVRALVEAWQREPDPVLAALRYFQDQGFVYTLTPPLLTGDFLDEFLFESRRGYCEHFAAAFAMLMRHVGIPSRLVVGYQGGEWNTAGGYLVVRQADAHAWVEVWREGRGWQRVDPTAVVAPVRIELGTTALQTLLAQGASPAELGVAAIQTLLEGRWFARQWHRLGMYWDAVNTFWNRWVMAYGPERQQRLLSSLGVDAPSWMHVVVSLVIGVAVLLLVLTATLLWTPNRTDPVTACYRRLCKKLGKTGLSRRVHEGPLDFYHRVSTARPELVADIKPIITLYVALRYGNVDSEDLVDQLRTRVRRFKATRRQIG